MKYKITSIDKFLFFGTLTSIIIIILVGVGIGRPVLIDSWDTDKTNYYLNQLTQLSSGYLISVLFYYLLVVVPEHRKNKTVSIRIHRLVDYAQVNQNRVISNLLNNISYNKNYYELQEEDYIEILKGLDKLIIDNHKKYEAALLHWHVHSTSIEKYLNKLLLYYKQNLPIDILVEVEELLESLYFRNISDLLHLSKNWDPNKSKVANIEPDFKEFDLKIRKLKELL